MPIRTNTRHVLFRYILYDTNSSKLNRNTSRIVYSQDIVDLTYIYRYNVVRDFFLQIFTRKRICKFVWFAAGRLSPLDEIMPISLRFGMIMLHDISIIAIIHLLMPKKGDETTTTAAIENPAKTTSVKTKTSAQPTTTTSQVQGNILLMLTCIRNNPYLGYDIIQNVEWPAVSRLHTTCNPAVFGNVFYFSAP